MVLGLDSLEEDTVAHLGHLEQHLPLRHFLKEWSHLQRVTFAKSVHRWQVDLMTLEYTRFLMASIQSQGVFLLVTQTYVSDTLWNGSSYLYTACALRKPDTRGSMN